MCHYRSHKHTHTHTHAFTGKHIHTHTCTHTHTCAKGWPHNPLFFDSVCMLAPEIESQLFSLYTHTYTQYTTEGPNLTGQIHLIHHVCRWTILCVMGQNIDVFLWIRRRTFDHHNIIQGHDIIISWSVFLYVKLETSQCSLAFCCLHQDYFTFVGQPKLRPDAKVVQRDPQCSIAPVALCCKRLHIVRMARKNIVYKRSLQAAPSKPVYFTL